MRHSRHCPLDTFSSRVKNGQIYSIHLRVLQARQNSKAEKEKEENRKRKKENGKQKRQTIVRPPHHRERHENTTLSSAESTHGAQRLAPAYAAKSKAALGQCRARIVDAPFPLSPLALPILGIPEPLVSPSGAQICAFLPLPEYMYLHAVQLNKEIFIRSTFVLRTQLHTAVITH